MSDVIRQREHVEGCAAPLTDRECDCPPERTYVAVDALLSDVTTKAVAERLDADVLKHWPNVAITRAAAYAQAAIAAVTREQA